MIRKPAETAWQGKRSLLTAAIDQQVNLRYGMIHVSMITHGRE